MPRARPTHGSRSLLLLGLLGLVGAGLYRIGGAPRAARSIPRTVACATSDARAAEAEPAGAGPLTRREAVPALAAQHEAETELAAGQKQRARPKGARTEREFLAEFLTSEKARAGALAEQAVAVLDGDGSTAQKVAFLRALRASHVPDEVAWHAHAVLTRADDAGPASAGLASYALATLARSAAQEPVARAALERLAFAEPALAPLLRRRAAADFARTCDEDELARLAPALAREPDELLRAGVLSALAERPPSAGALRILAAYPRPDPLPVAAR